VAPTREAAVTEPEVENDAASEGTCAHAIAEIVLNGGVPSAANVKDYDRFFNATMDQHLFDYVKFVQHHAKGGHLFTEQRLQIFPQQGVFGTADVVILKGANVHVIDLKYGFTEVEVESSQLRLYGVGSLEFNALAEQDLETVTVTVYQPRRNNIVSKTFTVAEIGQWVKDNMPKVLAACAGVGDATPGEHCRWCRVKTTCQERIDYNLATAGLDFADISGGQMIVPDAVGVDKLVEIFKKVPALEQFIKDVETRVKQLSMPDAVAGLKWVQGRGTRTIIDPEQAAKELQAVGIEPFVEPKLKTLTELDKLVKPLAMKLGDVIEIQVRHGASVLVPVEDPRPAFKANDAAAADFS
jgi:DNA-directed RNA polymerase subunit H (RpoH/RPB5)